MYDIVVEIYKYGGRDVNRTLINRIGIKKKKKILKLNIIFTVNKYNSTNV